MDPYEWQEASVAFPDYAGHVELDFRMTNSALEDAGLDRERWQVIGFEWDRGEQSDTIYAIAVDKAKDNPDDDTVRATKILLHDVDPAAFLHSITHSFGMTLRSRGTAGKTIVIDELADIPEQD